MTVLSAQTIRRYCMEGMIVPYYEKQRTENGLSYGLSSSSYDVRVEFNDTLGVVQLNPGEFMLASTIERVRVPRHLMVVVHDKSTWVRRGLTVQNSVIDPGFEGWITLELCNHGEHPLTVVKGDPIAQLVFHRLDVVTEMPYDGKYQYQNRYPQPAR